MGASATPLAGGLPQKNQDEQGEIDPDLFLSTHLSNAVIQV